MKIKIWSTSLESWERMKSLAASWWRMKKKTKGKCLGQFSAFGSFDLQLVFRLRPIFIEGILESGLLQISSWFKNLSIHIRLSQNRGCLPRQWPVSNCWIEFEFSYETFVRIPTKNDDFDMVKSRCPHGQTTFRNFETPTT